MRPVVVSAIFLLVVLMYMPHTVNAGLAEDCAAKYPAIPCNGTQWQQLDDERCMKIISEPLTYEEAQERCKSKGAELVSIHDFEQYNRLLCYLYRISNGERTNVWIGARRGDEGFYWSDGTGLITLDRWAPFQPDNWLFIEYCVEMNYWNWGLWNDRNCYHILPSVCAKKM